MRNLSMVLADYACLADVINHPEPKLLFDSQTPVQSDREIQRLLDNLIGTFSAGISLLNSY